MAGGAERVLRRRIKSVQSTKKITKAMELIAASRILKAQQRVNAARPYSEQITAVIRNLAAAGAGKGAVLLEQREEIRTVAFVAVAGDRGLCGGYNTTIIRTVEREMARLQAEGRTVGESLKDLEKRYPDLVKLILAKDGSLLNSIDIFINGESAHPGALSRPVKDGDKLKVIMIIQGG